MIESVEQRRVENIGKQVDNASLPAGSPMYYYCQTCGAQTAVLPEDWYRELPPKHCDECLPWWEKGKIDDTYDEWLKARGEEPVPR